MVLTPYQAKLRAEKYCAYQDRCHQEVKQKLREWGIRESVADDILVDLISDGFLDEERFARSFARGKFRIKKWGRIKITNELRKRNISAACIKCGLSEIEEDEYINTARYLIERRRETHKGENLFELKTYLYGKGYERDVIEEALK